MPDLTGPNSPVVGFILALTIGFLVGRTREPGPKGPPRPGMRDFLIIALLGAVAGRLGNVAIAIAMFGATIGAILVMRLQHPERNGITTERVREIAELMEHKWQHPEWMSGKNKPK